MAIKNNTMYNLVNESIYNIETQCKKEVYPEDIIISESKRLKKRFKRYGYSEDSSNEAILEFTKYFKNVNANSIRTHKKQAALM